MQISTPVTAGTQPIPPQAGAGMRWFPISAPPAPLRGPFPPQPGAGFRWYANVPLSPSEPTPVTVSFENGGLLQTKEIAWAATDLLDTDNLTIREGDSLLFRVGTGASPSSVKIVGLTRYNSGSGIPAAVLNLAPGQTVACPFPRAGRYTVTGTGATADGRLATRSTTVTVEKCDLGSSPAAWMQKSRQWSCPALAPDVGLEPDPRMKLFSLPVTVSDPVSYGLQIDAQEPRYIVARLGTNASLQDRQGPILANLRADGFRLFTDPETYQEAIESFPDGSLLVQTGLVLSPLLTNVVVRMEIVVGGVTFDEGTLVKILTPSDFNELGQSSVRFLRAGDVQTSVCHTTSVYQNGLLVGVL